MKLISRLIAPLLVGLGVVLGSLSALAFAQEPAAFEMRVIPWSEQAVAGQAFTYTVVITNIRPTPVQDIMVFMKTPTGTTFATTYQDNGWFVSGLGPGEVGAVGWATLEPISPSQMITFELGLNVLPEMANQVLVNDEYGVAPISGGEMVASGPPIKTKVVIGAATATPLPTATPILLPTLAAIAATPAISVTATRAATPAPTATVPPIQTKTTQAPPASTNRTGLGIISVAIVILLAIIGFIWFLKRK